MNQSIILIGICYFSVSNGVAILELFCFIGFQMNKFWEAVGYPVPSDEKWGTTWDLEIQRQLLHYIGIRNIHTYWAEWWCFNHSSFCPSNGHRRSNT